MRRGIVPAVVGIAAPGLAFVMFRPAALPPPGPAPQSRPSASDPAILDTEFTPIRVVTMTEGLHDPWALVFLPGGDLLITERAGTLRLIHDGRLMDAPIGGVPRVDTRKQDGLMDLALHPDFARNRKLYFTDSTSGLKGDTPVLASARFDGAQLSDVRDLFVADAWNDYGGNTGSRIAFAPDGTIWETEHGPRGGDELNVIVRGHNYGWAAITYGINYDDTAITTETHREGMDQPLTYWKPSIGPSGLTLYTGDRIPPWRGSLFLGALVFEHLRRVEVKDGRVVHQEILLEGLQKRGLAAKRDQRIRDVRQGPDGLLYVLVEAGALLRLEPAR